MSITIDRVAVSSCLLCGGNDFTGGVHKVKVAVGVAKPKLQEFLLDSCARCVIAWQNPMPTEHSVEEYYRKSASSSGAVSSVGSSEGSQQATRLQFRLRHFGSVSQHVEPRTVLDFGAGSSLSLKTVCSNVFPSLTDTFAVDAAPTVRESLRRFGVECWSRLDEIPCRMRFDLVLAFSVLEHVVDPLETLRGLKNRLTDNGEIWIVLPDSTSPRLSIGEFYGFEHLWHFSLQSLRILAEQVGLSCHVAQLGDGSIVAVASRGPQEASNPLPKPSVTANALELAFDSYRRNRLDLRKKVQLRVNQFVQCARSNSDQSLAVVWGTGQHTDQLFDVYPEMSCAHAFVDSAVPDGTTSTYRGVRTYAPSDAPWDSIGCVFVSSEAFMLDIATAIESAARADCEVILPYSRQDLTLPPEVWD